MKIFVVTSEGKRTEIDNIYELIITNPDVIRYKRRKGKESWDVNVEGAWLTPCTVVSIVVQEKVNNE